MEELERRLRARGTDPEEVIESRMRRAASEIGHWGEYDYVLINQDMDHCLAEVQSIINAERLRRDRRPYLFDFVRRLVGTPQLLIEQGEKRRSREEIALAKVDRRFSLGINPPMLGLPALVEADCLPLRIRVIPHARNGERRDQRAANGHSGDSPASWNASNAATACPNRSTVAGG